MREFRSQGRIYRFDYTELRDYSLPPAGKKVQETRNLRIQGRMHFFAKSLKNVKGLQIQNLRVIKKSTAENKPFTKEQHIL